jgi:PAS domain S-box-containing protein
MRKSGIDIIGNVPWGTHFCQFYQTKQDLIDVLTPYFRQGLVENEYCMWIASHPLEADEARSALARAVPDLDDYFRRGQIEILDYTQWYTAGGKFDADRVLQGWLDKENSARQRGFEGLRLTGNTFWLEQQDWKAFSDYEAVVNDVIGKQRMIAICTYSLDKCGAYELIDVVGNHQFALIKQAGEWKIIESRHQKKVEAALRESEQRYHVLVQQTPESLASFPEMNPYPIVEVDQNGRIHYLNPAAKRLFPDLLERGAGHPWLAGFDSFYDSFQAGGHESITREVAVGRRCFRQMAYLVKSDNRIRIYSLEITDLKQAETTLQEANERLEQIVLDRTAELRKTFSYARNLLEASLDPLITISPEGRISDVNKATEAATGVGRQQLIGSNFSAYFTDPAKAEEGYRTVLSKGSVIDYPLTIRHISGSTTDVLYNAAVYRNEAGEVQGVFAAARDMTEHNLMDKELSDLHKALEQRAAQLQSLASELTLAEQHERRRLAQILHDHLQQLLYAARLGMTTLRRRVANKELLSMIEHLDTLLGQCIEESRSVTMELSPPVLYDAGLAAALEWLSRQMRLNYGLTVEVDSDAQAEPEAEDIKVLLFHSVRELLFNVVKHAGATSATIKMSLTPDRLVRIDVADKGVGFDAERMQPGGDRLGGFGLFSVRERLELLGGRLEVNTNPGKGTTASLFAPCHWQKPPSENLFHPQHFTDGIAELIATDAACSPFSRKIRVLLVDDHAILRKGLAGVLSQEVDIEVVAEAGDGEKAVELSRQFNPDVVLMDVTMPKMDGIEATRRITAAQPGVGIIGLSAHKEEDMAHALYKAGAIGYLSKDEPAEFLIAAIRNIQPQTTENQSIPPD